MRPVALIVMMALAGCSKTTSLELTVEGDLEAGVDADELRLSTWLAGAELWSATRPLEAARPLPRRFEIEATSREELSVELLVEARRSGSSVAEARRLVSFVLGESVPVTVCLWRRCVEDPEAPGCAEGRCEPIAADGDADADADADGAPPDDGSVEDAPPDGDADDGVLCDDSCFISRGDGVCADTGPLSSFRFCPFGTDCTDCGPRYREDCVPFDCAERQCGSDGCFGTCGPGCGPAERCMFGGQCIEWVRIEPGTFLMGSPEAELGREDGETRHEVALSHAFEIASTEMTQRWVTEMMGVNSSSRRACGLDCPGGGYSWTQAAFFANLVSLSNELYPCYECTESGTCTGLLDVTSPYDCEGYRLPTEAEWEYAARAGATAATYNGDLDEGHLACESPFAVLDPVAWYCGNSAVTWETNDDCSERGGPAVCGPQPVGVLEPNAYGLYDMLGNVTEWVHDWYAPYPTVLVTDPFGPDTGERRIVRGGSFVGVATSQRVARRRPAPPEVEYANFGFRLARTMR